MVTLFRTDSTHPDYCGLIPLLDAELAHRDGDDHAFYAQYNKSDHIHHCIVAYLDAVPVGTGAIKRWSPTQMEVKRMYVLPAHRGQRIAVKVLEELERWAAELGFEACILETGIKQPEAIALYTRQGYKKIPNYGQYANVENSVCLLKELTIDNG